MLYCVYVGTVLVFSSSKFWEAVEQLGKTAAIHRKEETVVYMVREKTRHDEDGDEYTESDRLILSWSCEL